ncbi:hypothetical protein PDESU_05597 [Pontiella desulfatans]|uniref:DUF4357 domain-containing protein n=1 Tax=Pontiella desulfatans TaxID=2750659 RepID=A0A6C2UAX1_PONDE|nr:GIY-YIG nuclease family protein [Pontiella desulfatans]VGO17003.1 hypothetical protein PDESU_05597 [Pontiella desulfatans]
MQPATIKIFLTEGTPDGLRTAEISNWNGKAIACPRANINGFRTRPEIDSPGVYILSGSDPDTGKPTIYIGEAESVRSRIANHTNKDFWVSVTCFISKDENLTKAHVKYIEGQLIKQANDSGKVCLMNSSSSGARLPEADAAEMDVFLEKIYQLLPILGIAHFTQIEEEPSPRELFSCKIGSLVAHGRRTTNGFVVYKESQAVLKHRKSAVHTKRMRESLVENGILKELNDHCIFTLDHEFSSPSAAGAAVRGGSTNGLTAWKNSNGKSLKEIEAS